MRVFNEMQRFNLWWVHLINMVVILPLFYMGYQWFITKEAVGNVAINDHGAQLAVIFSALLLPIILYSIKLRTTIDERGIFYQFIPLQFSKKMIPWNDMKHCEVRTYNPLKEFGGWGLRISIRNGRAYNIKGNQGIQIILKTGKKILIGTQNEREAQEIIQRYCKEKFIV